MVDLAKAEFAFIALSYNLLDLKNHRLLYMQPGLVSDVYHQSMVGHILPSYQSCNTCLNKG